MQSIDLNSRIPNNVGLADDRRLRRALEAWQPRFLQWWEEMGPSDFYKHDIYLRTAVGVDTGGWAHYDYVKMPEYRWGIFLAPGEAERRIGFGEHKGDGAWQEVPGEYRAMLRRIVTIQGDTEPASIEQQRHLGNTAPSLYDLRNILQVNVEEARHLWAMVYLLHAYFGRDGREEADALLTRRSGDPDTPRILGAFNEKTANWLSFFMFTFFTDRDGKFQLSSLAESGFDPLARTTKFMLKEEAHHMFVGESGVQRIVARTVEQMRDHPDSDPRELGVIDLACIQRHINFHFSVTLDLFGSEVSTNAATSYTTSIKGRFSEDSIEDDHVLGNAVYSVLGYSDKGFEHEEVPALNALNERLRRDYIADVERGLARWNRVIEQAGLDFELKLPHVAFNREIGTFAGLKISPDGKPVTAEEFEAKRSEWLPTRADADYLDAIMEKPVHEPGRFANWIAPPSRGVNQQAIDFRYVRFN